MATFAQTAGAGCLGGLPIRWGQSGLLAAGTSATEVFAQALANGPGIILPYIIGNNATINLTALAMSGNATGITEGVTSNYGSGSQACGYITLGDQATLGEAGSFNFGDIIFQWGSQTNSAGYQSDGSYSVPFGTAFPNNCWWAAVFPILPTGTIGEYYAWPFVSTYTPDGITVIPSETDAPSPESFTEVGYFAIGN